VSLFVLNPEIEDRDEIECSSEGGQCISFSMASDILQLLRFTTVYFLTLNDHLVNYDFDI
jgi:hypothetical protein